MISRARKKKEEMNGNSLGVVLSPGGLAVADRASGSRPDPEVVAKPKRRTFTAEYKQRILEEAEVVAATRGSLKKSPSEKGGPSAGGNGKRVNGVCRTSRAVQPKPDAVSETTMLQLSSGFIRVYNSQRSQTDCAHQTHKSTGLFMTLISRR
jgi:hypothetical protein